METLGKYRTVTVYYEGQPPVGDGALGKYINELFAKGIDVIQIIAHPKPKPDRSQDKEPVEAPYTTIQGNVGSS